MRSRPARGKKDGWRLLVAAGLGAPVEHALISFLALNGLRVSEATGERLGVTFVGFG